MFPERELGRGREGVEGGGSRGREGGVKGGGSGFRGREGRRGEGSEGKGGGRERTERWGRRGGGAERDGGRHYNTNLLFSIGTIMMDQKFCNLWYRLQGYISTATIHYNSQCV